jgi:predicted nucleic acid-binding protein
MDTVYIETTIVGHLSGRLLADATVAARQCATREWWKLEAMRYQCFISLLVIDECSAGDAEAAEERLQIIANLDVLGGSPEADALAGELLKSKAIPATEPRDAMHISLAATNGIKYLLTWNFKHIANAQLRSRIEATCRVNGFEPPIICTPEELMGIDNGT